MQLNSTRTDFFSYSGAWNLEKLNGYSTPTEKKLFLATLLLLSRLISRSSECLDNQREKGKVVKRHKVADTPAHP